MYKVDRDNPAPLYEQIKQILTHDIRSGRYVEGDRLPTEYELCQHFNVSRITVVRALTEMSNEGLIQRIQGKGSIVRPIRQSNRALSNIQGFTDALQLQGFETYSRVLEVAEQQADTALLEGLGIDATTEATQVIRIRRLRYVDGLPAAILTTLVRADLGTRMQRYRLEEVSFFDLYQEILGQRVSRSEATLQVTLADAECQALMGVEAGSPHFRYSARNYLEDSTPVEVVHGVFRGDMFHFRTVVVTVGEESPFIVATDS